MTEEVVTQVTADTPAPDQEATVAPDAGVSTPVEQPTEVAKVFTQEELNEIVSKRLAKEQRKWEREQAQRAAPAAPIPPADVSADQYASPEEYAQVLAERIVESRDSHRAQNEINAAYEERVEEALEKYADFKQVALDPSLPVSNYMAQAIKSSDLGPDILYHLGENPKEATRISKLTPLLQAKEIGRIEALVASKPAAVKKVTNAPAPITPVHAKGGSSGAFDTTDSRSIKSMSTSDWIAAERLRQVKRVSARAIK